MATEITAPKRKYDEAHQRVRENRSKLLAILERTVDNKGMVLDAVEPLKEKVIMALMDMATGILVDDEDRSPRKPGASDNKERVYRRQPNITALTKLLSLIDVNTNDAASALLRYTQSEGAMAEVDAGLAVAKALNLQSATEFNIEQTKTFTRSLVDEDKMNDGMLTLFYEFAGVIQSESREMLFAASQSDEAHSKRIEHIGERAKKAMRLVLEKHGVLIEEPGAEDTGDYVAALGESEDEDE